jgi:cathepsin D
VVWHDIRRNATADVHRSVLPPPTVDLTDNLVVVDFDTGSSDIFLPSVSCTENCEGHARYNPGTSSTATDFGSTFTLKYGDGSSVSGEQYTDMVSIAGLTATGQRVGSATTYSSGFQSSNFEPDGLVGMGFAEISSYNANPVFLTLSQQGQTDSSTFAFKLAESGAELFLGGVNKNLYTGGFTYSPVLVPVCIVRLVNQSF